MAILHLDSGLAVFALKTGRRLTHLPLPEPPPSTPAFVYSDLNSDGTPELITIDSEGERERERERREAQKNT